MGIHYSVDHDPDTTARAMLRDEQISLKHSKALAREIKDRTADDAVAYLEAVRAEEQAVPFRQHNSGVGHRSGLENWDAGRYPEKAAGAFLDLLENAIGNAESQGFNGGAMGIMHVAAHKVGESRGRKPRAMGRASEWNTTEVDVELILEDTDAGPEADS